MTESTTTPSASIPVGGRSGSAAAAIDDVRGVGVLVRLVAYVLDAVLLALVIYAILFVLHALIGPTVRISQVDGVPRVSADRLRSFLDTAQATSAAGLYFAGWWLAWGATPAQRLVRARVERADGGGRLAPGSAIKR